MTVLLSRPYGSYPAGAIVALPASTEAALVTQGLATVSSAVPAPTGAQSSQEFSGRAAVAIGAASVVITNPWITASTKVWAVVAQAAADSTAVRVERVVAAAGSATIYVTAAATAATVVDWAIVSQGEAPIL